MRWLVATLTSLVIATPAAAQEADPFQRAARETRLASVEPVAVLFISGAFGDPADSYSFYSHWDKPYGVADRRRGFAVRKASRTDTSVLWTTSFNCEAVIPALNRMEDIQLPRIDFWGIGEDEPPRLAVDGVSFDLWSRWPAWPGSTGYFVRMGSNLGSPLADWAMAMATDLDPCWSEEVPGTVTDPR